MIGLQRSIENLIFSALQKGPLGTIELIEEIKKQRTGTSKQAVYQELKKLKKKEVIIIYNKKVSLSHVWVSKMAEFFDLARYRYVKTTNPGDDFLMLADGDKISYKFKSFEITDMFWGHLFFVLADVVPTENPFFIYNLHEWFFLARYESERNVYDSILKTGRQILLLNGAKDPLDAHVVKEFDGKKSQYYMANEIIFEKQNYYVTTIGDFIIEAWLDAKVSQEIDDLYKTTKVFNEDIKDKLIEIVKKPGKNKLVISRNTRKAEKLKKLFAKYFFIKK